MSISKHQNMFLLHIKSSSNQSLLQAKSQIKQIYKQMPELGYSFKKKILQQIINIKSIVLLIYTFSLIQNQLKYEKYKIKQSIKNIKKYRESYESFVNWLEKQTKDQIYQISQIVVEYFPQIFIKIDQQPQYQDLYTMIFCFNIMNNKSKLQAEISAKFLLKIQQLKKIDKNNSYYSNYIYLSNNYEYQRNENKGLYEIERMILQIICNIGSKKAENSKLGLLFNKYIFNQINCFRYFFSLQQIKLLQFDEKAITNLFQNITSSGITMQILIFIEIFSQYLKEGQQFYKLKYLAQNYLFSNLILRTKTCNKKNVGEKIYQISQFYIVGFSKQQSFKFLQNGIICLLANVQHLPKDTFRNKWITLAKFLAEKQHLDNFFKQLCKNKKIQSQQMSTKFVTKCEGWKINARSLKKLKKYQKYPSDLKGISNGNNFCYIISVVQALNSLNAFIQMIYKSSQKTDSIKEFYHLFQSLKIPNKSPNVKFLKFAGPKYFRYIQSQEDAHNYLIQLLQDIQKKSKQSKENLKNIFNIVFQSQQTCQKCSNKLKSQDQSYIHTISHKQRILFQQQQEIDDYKCSVCSNLKHRKITKMIVKGKILIVHINRFTVDKLSGQTLKQLTYQKIQRKIKDFTLKGMIFHIGKKINNGHYVYYNRLQTKPKQRWAQMNDHLVTEFVLDNQNQQFQRQMKAQKTPYILFYVRI